MENVFYASIFFLLFGLYATLFLALRAKKTKVSERIKDFVEDRSGLEKRMRIENALNERVKTRKSFFSKFLTHNMKLQYEQKLILAGSRMTAGDLVFVKLVAAILGGFFMFAFSGGFAAAIIGMVIGFLIPNVMVKRKIVSRQKKLESQIADSLVLMANALRSGQSFNYAMSAVVTSMHPPISLEFERTIKEMALGAEFEQAMLSLSDRNNSEDLELVINAVMVQRQVGGNLAEVLDRISYTIRERFRIRGEIKTLTAQGRFSALVVGGLPIGLLAILYMINPAYISLLFSTVSGNIMLAVGAALETLGITVLKKMVNLKY